MDENDSLKILSLVLSIAIISSNRKKLNKRLYNDNNGTIELIGGDLLALAFNKKLAISKRIVVIPVDDKFTMIFHDEEGEGVISKDTIHGKWLIRMNKKGIDMSKIKYIIPNGIIKLGKCRVDKTEFYLLPVSSLAVRNKAQSGNEMIRKALNALAAEYNVAGQGVPIYVPLIGTGRSRAHLTLNESILLIKETFIKNESGFFGDVKIIVYPKNIDDLEEI